MSNKAVQIFHRLNKLKLKAGIPLDQDELGYIDPKALRRAQDAINQEVVHYSKEIEAVLVKLDSTWVDLRTAEKLHYKRFLDQLYNYANNIKDLAETYNYDLMQHFGLSLRDFCERIDLERNQHHTIVQAHIDVMWVAFKEDIGTGGTKADELKLVLAQAIDLYG